MRKRRRELDAPLYELVHGRPRLRPAVRAESSGVRRLGELADVTAVTVSPQSREIQYWTFAGVAFDEHEVPRPLSYDLTFIAPRAVGWERPKTYGHVHAEPELYEVLEGRGAFLIQDLEPGPAAGLAVLVEAAAGECVVIPPNLHHVTVNCSGSLLAVADVVSRRAEHEYSQLRAARGAAFFLRVDGEVVQNPSYRRLPPLTRLTAIEWSDAGTDVPLYRTLVERPAELGWLDRPDGFASRFPDLAELTPVAGR